MPFPANPVEARQNDLEMARRKAEETAAALRAAPQASYPGQAKPMQPGASSGQYGASAGNAAQAAVRGAQAPAAQPYKAPLTGQPDARGYAPAQPSFSKSQGPGSAGVEAVKGVTQRAATRGEGYVARGQQQASIDNQRRQQLRDQLRMQAFKLANPGASPLELDMARRGGR